MLEDEGQDNEPDRNGRSEWVRKEEDGTGRLV